MEDAYLEHSSRKKMTDRPKKFFEGSAKRVWTDYLAKTNSKFIVMGGSAQRKPASEFNMAEEQQNGTISDLTFTSLLSRMAREGKSQAKPYEFLQKIKYKKEFSKLREPYRMPRNNKLKNSQEIPASKSFRGLLECLKLYQKETDVENKNFNAEQHLVKIKKNEEKMGKKMQFFDFSNISSGIESFFSGYDLISHFEYNAKTEGEEFNFLNLTFAKNKEATPFQQADLDLFANLKSSKGTFSSQDFMKNAFPRGKFEIADSDAME